MNNHALDLQKISDSLYARGDPVSKNDYLAYYAERFDRMRRAPLSILELGVHQGTSLLMWRDYFTHARIVGLDINPKPARLFEAGDRVSFVQGSQSDPAALAQAVEANGGAPFDIIIDDAAHIGHLARASFDYLFTRHLVPGGVYVIEDYGAPVAVEGWPDGAPYAAKEHRAVRGSELVSYQNGMMGFLKQLVDHMVVPPGLSEPPHPIARIDILPHVAFVTRCQ